MNDEQIKTDPDIVQRLRDRSENWEIDCKFDPSCDDAQMDREAADEIERLRSKLAQLESETDDLRRDLPA